MKTEEPVFAIVRFDEFHPESTPLDHRVSVVRIVRDQGTAESEVDRLTDANSHKGCRYRWYLTVVVHWRTAPHWPVNARGPVK
jgi:hypothetical protein